MGLMQTAAQIWRDFVTDGVPPSGKQKPRKSDIRAWGTWVEGVITAFTSNGGLIYTTKAAMDADLGHDANSLAWVVGDPVVANNGIYGKVGTSGLGSWTRRADLPFSFIVASDVGAGAPNAIQATSSIPVSASSLVWMNVFEANTSSPVTVSFNAEAPLTIKSNSGNDISAAGLSPGMIVMGIVSGATFRLVSDQASAAVVAAAEAAKTAAEQARDVALAAAAGVTLPPIAANRMLVDNAAGTARESKTFSQVRDLLDPIATKIFGASSIARSLNARFGDTISLRDFLTPDGLDAGAAGNDAGFAALIAYITANPGVRTVRGHKGDIYRTTAVNLVLPTDVRLMMDAGKFRWSGLLGGGSSTFMTFSSGCKVDGLDVEIVSGSTLRRLLANDTDLTANDWYIHAESQIANANGLLDYAVRFNRNNNKIRGVKVENINKAVLAYGADGDGLPGLNNRFSDIEVVSYQTAFELRNLLDCRNTGFRARTRSTGALPDPGNNGLLHSGVADYVLSDFIVRDAPEHGVRFGGTRNSEQITKGVTINNGEIRRPAQSGLKFFTGGVGGRFYNVNATGVNVIDCQWEPERPAELPGFNDEGFLLQQIVGGIFSGISVSKQDQPTYSSDCCLYISGATNLVVNGLRGESSRRDFIRIAETDDGAGGAAVETLANNGVTIKAAYGTDIKNNGLYIQHPTQSLRDLNISFEATGDGVAAGMYGFNCGAAAARFVQPCIVEYKVRGFSAGSANFTSTTNIKIRDLAGGTY